MHFDFFVEVNHSFISHKFYHRLLIKDCDTKLLELSPIKHNVIPLQYDAHYRVIDMYHSS